MMEEGNREEEPRFRNGCFRFDLTRSGLHERPAGWRNVRQLAAFHSLQSSEAEWRGLLPSSSRCWICFRMSLAVSRLKEQKLCKMSSGREVASKRFSSHFSSSCWTRCWMVGSSSGEISESTRRKESGDHRNRESNGRQSRLSCPISSTHRFSTSFAGINWLGISWGSCARL